VFLMHSCSENPSVVTCVRGAWIPNVFEMAKRFDLCFDAYRRVVFL
jgi:hypothetical protein